jgi:signal transduction histidine kinase
MTILNGPEMTRPQQNAATTRISGQRRTMRPLRPRGASQTHDPVDFVALLQPLVDRGREHASNKSVRVEFVHDEARNVCIFDENKFFQIAACLLQNAIRSTSRGTIAVIAKRERCWFHLTVTDTGRGDAGAGGLITARKLTGLFGGSLAVASKTGEGTIAQVCLPVIFLTGQDVTAVPLEVIVNGRRYDAG